MTHMKTLDGTAASHFAFGTMQFGGTANETASREMFDASRDAGINHFDTAYIYTDGASETILGELANPVREQVIVASKVAYDGVGDTTKLQADFDVSRKRLAMECVDVLYLHRHVGANLPRAIEWLAQQQSAGMIRYIGLSNFAAWQVMDAVALAKSNDTRIDIIQPMYNLVKRQAEVELLPMCKDQGIACAPYSPLGGGLLTGKYSNGGNGRLKTDDRYNARYSLAYMHETAKALKELGDELGVNPATLAVAWVARHEAGPVPLLSARSQKQLQPSLNAISFQMDDALYARITALSPTPPPATDRWEERV
ncbi:aldo/keto reductase [Planktotalea sp.]|uniref:aldo/keto reductase n=1 Tax=Planktotalea sp. TaxID=2029877 RepID=UPI0025EF31E8|nr:aldo/keto reductase [Planktotalea sp.]